MNNLHYGAQLSESISSLTGAFSMVSSDALLLWKQIVVGRKAAVLLFHRMNENRKD